MTTIETGRYGLGTSQMPPEVITPNIQQAIEKKIHIEDLTSAEAFILGVTFERHIVPEYVDKFLKKLLKNQVS